MKPRSVTDYISSAPNEIRPKLRELRATIKTTCPDAVEKISYGMPYYHFHGRLAYFALAKNHIGLYIPTPVIEEHARELAKYDADRATIRFPLDKRLPLGLIRKLVRARMRKNLSKSAS